MFLTKRSGKSMLIILVGCGLVSVALGVGAGLFLGKRAQAGTAHGKNSKKQKHGAEAPEVGAIFSIGEVVVNLADMDVMRYAKASVAFGFREKVPDEKFKEKQPILRDTVIGVLTRRTFIELHRKGGIPKLKREILEAAGARVRDTPISEIYIEGFAMQ
jgi:flagellar basal body-associated protein FliL